MKINIYNRKNIVKTYEASEYDVELGVLEDLMSVINIENLQSLSEEDMLSAVRNLMMTGRDSAYEILHTIFDDITDEEIRHTHVDEIATLLMETLKAGMKAMTKGITSGKNVMSATMR